MAVVPVRARLPHLEAIHVGLARTNAVEAETWHAVHVRGQENAVPVNRRVLVERVRHAQRDRVAFLPPQRRRWHRAVHGERHSRVPREVHRRFADAQVEVGSGERGPGDRRIALRECRRPPQAEARYGAAGGEALDEGAPRDMSSMNLSM